MLNNVADAQEQTFHLMRETGLWTLLSLNVTSNFKANCKVVYYLSSGNCVSNADSDNPDKGVAQLFDIKVLTNF